MSRCLRGPAVVNRGRKAQLDGQVDGLGVGHAGHQQVHGLADHGVLQAVAQEAGHVLLDAQGDLVQPLPDLAGPVHGFVRGVLPADDLEDGDDVGGLEEVGTGDAVGMGHALAELGDGQAGGVARQHRVPGGRRVHAPEDLLLGLEVLGDRLDDELRGADRFLQPGGRADAAGHRGRRSRPSADRAFAGPRRPAGCWPWPGPGFPAAGSSARFPCCRGPAREGDLAAHEAASHDGRLLEKEIRCQYLPPPCAGSS